MSPLMRLVWLGVIWFFWVIPFFLNRARGQGKAVRIDRKARLGILLVAAAFLIANTHSPVVWSSAIDLWRGALGIFFGLAGAAIAFAAVGRLGRQWRFDAGINDDHELVQTGAYSVVRHPIYLSILCMLMLDIALVGTLPGWPVALALGLMGTEIRVRVEDTLLRERFGPRFIEWQKRVPAYLPFMR